MRNECKRHTYKGKSEGDFYYTELMLNMIDYKIRKMK